MATTLALVPVFKVYKFSNPTVAIQELGYVQKTDGSSVHVWYDRPADKIYAVPVVTAALENTPIPPEA